DGSQIEMVEIEGPFSGIAPQAVLIDTPGIDSTDDAHFLSASSILHQADALFYVVHYNHVHSEENVKFL
ncbi:dynamin family protein, partial [Bacillus paralicheniformis]